MSHLHPGRADDVPPMIPRRSPVKLVAAGVLLMLPVAALLWVSSYNRETPRIAGFPFFFWYQFLWVFLTSGCTLTAFWLVRDPGRDAQGRRLDGTTDKDGSAPGENDAPGSGGEPR